MKLRYSLLSLILAGPPALASGASTVKWENPDAYTDIKSSGGSQEDFLVRSLSLLEDYISEAAKRYLSDGHSVQLTVTDVDLAGQLRMTGAQRGHQDVRVIKDIYPAKMKFRYQLLDSAGNVIDQGEEELRSRIPGGLDMRTRSNLPLAIEQQMIERWFRQKFK